MSNTKWAIQLIILCVLTIGGFIGWHYLESLFKFDRLKAMNSQRVYQSEDKRVTVYKY